MTAQPLPIEGTQDQTAEQIVGEAIHVLMRRKGMTQAELAAHLGMHQSALSNKLRGRRPWYLLDMQRAATALGVDVAALVAGLPRLDSNQQPSGYLSAQVIDLVEYRRGAHEAPAASLISSPGQRRGRLSLVGGAA